MKKILRLCLTIAAFVATSGRALAEEQGLLDPLAKTTPTLDALMTSLMNRIPYFLGGFAFIAILYSGAIYVLALGDTNKMEMAKKNITWVVIGILAAASVFAVIEIIIKITNPIAPVS